MLLAVTTFPASTSRRRLADEARFTREYVRFTEKVDGGLVPNLRQASSVSRAIADRDVLASRFESWLSTYVPGESTRAVAISLRPSPTTMGLLQRTGMAGDQYRRADYPRVTNCPARKINRISSRRPRRTVTVLKAVTDRGAVRRTDVLRAAGPLPWQRRWSSTSAGAADGCLCETHGRSNVATTDEHDAVRRRAVQVPARCFLANLVGRDKYTPPCVAMRQSTVALRRVSARRGARHDDMTVGEKDLTRGMRKEGSKSLARGRYVAGGP